MQHVAGILLQLFDLDDENIPLLDENDPPCWMTWIDGGSVTRFRLNDSTAGIHNDIWKYVAQSWSDHIRPFYLLSPTAKQKADDRVTAPCCFRISSDCESTTMMVSEEANPSHNLTLFIKGSNPVDAHLTLMRLPADHQSLISRITFRIGQVNEITAPRPARVAMMLSRQTRSFALRATYR